MQKGAPHPADDGRSSPSGKSERGRRSRYPIRRESSRGSSSDDGVASVEQISATDLRNLIHVSTASIGCIAFDSAIDCSLPSEEFTRQIFSTPSRCLEGNLQFAGLIGSSSPEDIIGVSLSEILPRHRRFTEMFSQWHRHNLSGQGFEFEGVDRDDRAIVFQAAIYGHIENEKLHRIWIILRDVTTVTRAISALSKSQKHYRTLFNSPGILFIRVLSDGTIEHATPSTISQLAITEGPSLTIDAALETRVHPSDRPHFEALQEHRRSGLSHIFEAPLRLLQSEGSYSEWTLRQTAHVNSAGELDYYDILGFERHAATQTAHVAGTLHDLNNHLVVAKANIELALAHVPLGNPAREMLVSAITAMDDSTKCATRALGPTLQPQSHPEPIPVEKLLSETTTLLRPMLPKGISLIVGEVSPEATVVADIVDLKRALINLIINAQEALVSGGTISLSAATATTGATAPHVAISVSDNGPGIAPENLSRIFTPFVTTKSSGRPRGLGLTMVKALVEENKGTVTVTSPKGVGTTFTLSLPAYLSASTRPLPALPPSVTATQTPRSILLADDQADVRYTVTAALTHRGHQVVAVPDMKSLIHELQSHANRFDVIVVDRGLMNLAPKELLLVASTLTKKVPCIITSGDPCRTDTAPLGNDTATFLSKPFTLDALYRSIENPQT